MRMWKALLALGAFFVLAAAVAGCGSSIPGNAVATMAGNPISLTAYKHWMYVAAKGQVAQEGAGAPVIVPTDPPKFASCIKQARAQIPTLAKTADKTLRSDCQQLFTSLNTEVMDFLIKAYWYQAEASRLHIKLTQKQIQAQLNQAKSQEFKTAAQFNTFLSETGQTLQDILYRVKVNALLSKLEARHNQPVNAGTISSYYKAHLKQFGTPQTRDIRVVRTKTASAAQAARSALQHGQSWKTVAGKYSVDKATKNNGGLLTGVTSGEEEQALNSAAFGAPAGRLEGPVHGTFGYYVFEVAKIHKGTQQTLAQATPEISQLLKSQSSQSAENAVNKVAKQHWFAKTQCRSQYSMADCHGYKAPKATTPTPTPTTATPTTATSSSQPTTTTPPTGTATTSTSSKKSSKK